MRRRNGLLGMSIPEDIATRLRTGDPRQRALLVVDMQVDFMPGGALPVPEADRLVPLINAYVAAFADAGALLIFSRDWHDPAHESFRSQGGPWPVHCVAGSDGAAFAPGLHVPPSALIVSKGVEPRSNGYSAFEATRLAETLAQRGVRELFVAGVATDYCVRASVLDARAAGLQVNVLADAIAGVDVRPGDSDRALAEMQAAGARVLGGAPHNEHAASR
ncbi:MAG: nicotinamidase [Steroidobacteraceae bacterium]|nr:nicotinamidase [Steroidobacteraceae bacterium]MDW8257969.1 nicotinamidase [Gammaproteobacteria bacterium]